MDWKKWSVAILFLSVVWIWKQWPDARLHVAFCDVGQGDASVIVLGPFQALVDTGANKNKVLKCLGEQMPFWDKRIEVVFISHADKDHSGALPEIRKSYRVDRVIDNPQISDVVRYGLLSFDIVKGSEPIDTLVKSSSETNAKSVVMRVTYGELSLLFTGDTDLSTELALVSSGVLKKSEVLKVSHHGSKYGSGNEFLSAVSPRFAIVSVGEKNTYGHPAGDTLIRLDDVGAKVIRTDKVGTISLVSDGKKLEVFTER